MLYKDWLKEWLENYIKPRCKMRTFERYKLIVDKHIIKNLGAYELNDITIFLLQNYISQLSINGNIKTGQGLSGNSVNTIISVLQSSLKVAKLLSYSSNYIADKSVRPKVIEKKIECFSIIEQSEIENYCISNKKKKLYGVIICLYTGLRIGELLALKFSDIDFSNCTMYISKTCHDSKNGRVIESPKTTSSNRIIPLPKQILKLIKELKNISSCDYLIADYDKPVSVRAYQRTFELMLKKLKITHKGFHWLRHTFATRALECGIDVKTLSELLGHKNINITLNRYVHSMFEHKQQMMNKLAKNLK
jgi:integrase